MNNKNIIIKSGNVTYYVNHEKKTVVAVIKCYMGIPFRIFERMFEKFKDTNGNNNLFDVRLDITLDNIQSVSINERYVGIAKCHEGDTFDEEFGKKLALAKAKEKKAKAINDRFFKFIEQLDDLNYIAGKKSDELYRRWFDSIDEIESLLNSIARKVSF